MNGIDLTENELLANVHHGGIALAEAPIILSPQQDPLRRAERNGCAS